MRSALVSYLRCLSGYRQREIWFQILLVNIYEASLGQFNGLERCGRDSSGRVEIWYQIRSLIKAVSMSCEAAVTQTLIITLCDTFGSTQIILPAASVPCLRGIFQVQCNFFSRLAAFVTMLFYPKHYFWEQLGNRMQFNMILVLWIQLINIFQVNFTKIFALTT